MERTYREPPIVIVIVIIIIVVILSSRFDMKLPLGLDDPSSELVRRGRLALEDQN